MDEVKTGEHDVEDRIRIGSGKVALFGFECHPVTFFHFVNTMQQP